MSKQIWIDLTDMLAWSGHYTGIQRVTYEYAVRFKKDGARYFAYDPVGDRFFELELEESLSSRTNTQDAPSENTPLSLKRRIRHILGTPYYRLGDKKRAFMQPYVHALNHTVRSMLHAMKKVIGGTNQPGPYNGYDYAAYPDALFCREDTVVLLGAGWNEMSVLKNLAALRPKIGFRISQHINDILPIYQPHLFADELPKFFLPYVKLAVESADVITVISEATKRDVVTFCEQQGLTKLPAVRVIRLGDNPQHETLPSKPDGILADEDFILAVGTFEIRKNYQLIYQTVKLAELEGKELPKIVIAGRKGWLTDDIRHVLERDPFVRTHIIWLSDVNDSELRWLYEKCMFTVFPSLAEGWGLPIAESLGYGKMCLASGVSSMLEIGDGLVDYFLPYDPRECMEKILYYTFESRYKNSNKKVRSKYNIYTWEESYARLVEAVS